ncbi:DUF6049 family protein [Janibacter melonis]|uniref:DUF6049 family protein n=1 Tax=Janibacter melonis TaxID=262209 RepID=UPI00177CCB77|nr:hypothetical protein [Janibacter melonis]
MAAARGRRLRSLRGACVAAALAGLLAPALPARASASDASSSLTLTSITPVVDATGASSGSATIRGRLTNDGSTTLENPAVAVLLGEAEMTREGIDDWAKGEQRAAGETLDRDVAARRLAPGQSTGFTLEVDGADLLPGRSWGAVPISVQSPEDAVHTFLGIHRAKEYEPLKMLWGVPVTLPPLNQLWTSPGERRTRAWREAAGPGSDLARLAASGPRPGDVRLVDPLLLPEAVPGADSGVPRAERELRADLAEALDARLDPRRTIVLPEADADVAAATQSDAARTLVRPRVTGAQRAADDLGARADVAWPADDLVSEDRADALEALYGRQPAVVVPRTALTDDAFTPHAFQSTSSGTPLLVSDPELSTVAGDLQDPGDAVLATQRLVADSASILGDLPGTARTILVVPPRSSRPDPRAYRSVREAVASIPWTARGDITDESEEQASEPLEIPDTLDDVPTPQLTETRARRLVADVVTRRSVATVRADGPRWQSEVAASQLQLTSARWRSGPWHFRTLATRLHAEVERTGQEVRLASGEVNFFADTGRLQVTVENTSDVELKDLHVRLRPGSPILRIDDEPEPVVVAARSRRTVTVQASALAPGRVPIVVEVTDPQGRVIGEPAELRVRVSPTGGWIYWGVALVALASVAFGTWRTVRRRPTPAAPADPEDS